MGGITEQQMLGGITQIRVARPTDKLSEVVAFYAGLALQQSGGEQSVTC